MNFIMGMQDLSAYFFDTETKDKPQYEMLPINRVAKLVEVA